MEIFGEYFLQTKTMEMMYETIHKALVEVQLDQEYVPQDFLNFFCLGNREVTNHRDRNVDAGNSSADNTSQVFFFSSVLLRTDNKFCLHDS